MNTVEGTKQERQHHDQIAAMLMALPEHEIRRRELRYLYHQQCFLSRLGEISGGRLLECGCGQGIMLCWLATRGAEVWGFDISPKMVELASRRAKLWGLDGRIRLECMPFEEIDYRDDFFDVVYGDFVLHHLDIDVSAQQVKRVLRKGGKILFRETSAGKPLLEAAQRASSPKIDPSISRNTAKMR